MLGSGSAIDARERVIVALDCDYERALGIAQALEGRARWVKLGMTLFYRYGPELVAAFKNMGYKVFLDLKFFDIPHQVHGAAASACASGADMLTFHASGGTEMMRQGLEGVVAECGADRPLPALIGVTVLTSMSPDDLAAAGVVRPLEEQVACLAKQVAEAGLHGVVCSPHEASAMRALLGEQAFVVTPGVRPQGASLDDQTRVATPARAVANGASHIVVGRPIVAASDPVAAFEAILAELEEG